MAAETAVQFEALERQAQTLMSVFTKAGHEAVAPAIIQPADIFLDAVGETLRARTYVFTDPDGAELCLRPDLTLPTCRLHVARHADAATTARYCYNGPAFRFQPQGADEAHPREFRQCGIERFGDRDKEAADAETIALVIAALERAGLKNWTLRIGDLGLFRAVLAAADLPARWTQRLADAFWRPNSFRAELKRMVAPPRDGERALPAELARNLLAGNAEASELAVAAYLEGNGVELIGTRTLAELADRLMSLARDANAQPLDPAAARLIESYVGVQGPARVSGEKVAALLKGARGGTGRALEAYDRRLALLANAGIDLDRVGFSAEFGRTLEYYTGLVFEVLAPGLKADTPVAGGGRYDNLLRLAGAREDVAAVGGAIHTQRLLQVVTGGKA